MGGGLGAGVDRGGGGDGGVGEFVGEEGRHGGQEAACGHASATGGAAWEEEAKHHN